MCMQVTISTFELDIDENVRGYLRCLQTPLETCLTNKVRVLHILRESIPTNFAA